MWQFILFVDLKPLLYYFVITKTLDLSNEKFKSCSWSNIHPEKLSKASYDQDIHPLQDYTKNCCNSSSFWKLRYFLLNVCQEDTESE